MLGAAHSAANPLTARFGTVHGNAVGILLPHVVRFNEERVGPLYDELMPALKEVMTEDDGSMLDLTSGAAAVADRHRDLHRMQRRAERSGLRGSGLSGSDRRLLLSGRVLRALDRGRVRRDLPG